MGVEKGLLRAALVAMPSQYEANEDCASCELSKDGEKLIGRRRGGNEILSLFERCEAEFMKR